MKTHSLHCRFFFVTTYFFLVIGILAQSNLFNESRHAERRALARQSIQEDIQAILHDEQTPVGASLEALSEKLRKAYVLFGYDSLPLDMRRSFLKSMVSPDDQKNLVRIFRKELECDIAENRVLSVELLSQRLLDGDSVPILKDIYDNGWKLSNDSRLPLTSLERFALATGSASMGKPVDLPLLEEFLLDPAKGFELDSAKGSDLRLFALLCINAGQLEIRDAALDAALRDSDPTFAFFAFAHPKRNYTSLAAAAFQQKQIGEGRYGGYGRQDVVLALLIRVNVFISEMARDEKDIFSQLRDQIRISVLAIMDGENESLRTNTSGLLRYVCGPGDVEMVRKLLKDPSDKIVQDAMLTSCSLSIEERKTLHSELVQMLSPLPEKNPLLFHRVVRCICDDLGLKVEKKSDMEMYQRVLEAVPTR